MRIKDELAELPIALQVVLKGFGLGAAIGTCFAFAMLIQYLGTADRYKSEMLYEGAVLYLLVVGFPTSLLAYPVFALAPWAGMVLIPAVNCALLALAGYGLYLLIGRLPYIRDL